MKTSKSVIFLTVVILITAFTGCQKQSNSTQTDSPSSNSPLPESGINILFIGNSLTYTNDLPVMLERLLLIQSIEVGLVESIAYPNVGLPDHWENSFTRERLRQPGWDLVILQQGPSATEGRPYLLDYTPLFAEEARISGGRAGMFMVWPWLSRYSDFPRVSDSYATAARENDAYLYPAGEAWLNAWSEDPSLQLYSSDNFHPSILGTYLSALVMLEQIGEIELNTLAPLIPSSTGDVEISNELATILQNAAIKANRDFALIYPDDSK